MHNENFHQSNNCMAEPNKKFTETMNPFDDTSLCYVFYTLHVGKTKQFFSSDCPNAILVIFILQELCMDIVARNKNSTIFPSYTVVGYLPLFVFLLLSFGFIFISNGMWNNINVSWTKLEVLFFVCIFSVQFCKIVSRKWHLEFSVHAYSSQNAFLLPDGILLLLLLHACMRNELPFFIRFYWLIIKFVFFFIFISLNIFLPNLEFILANISNIEPINHFYKI